MIAHSHQVHAVTTHLLVEIHGQTAAARRVLHVGNDAVDIVLSPELGQFLGEHAATGLAYHVPHA